MISIIIPFKNAERYIAECLHSIFDQTFCDWELILVDDHSTDSSTSIIEKITGGQNRRIIMTANARSGIIPALQTGLTHARGQYVTRMDADDLMPENRIELMVNALKDTPPKTIATGLVRYFADYEISDGYRKYEHWLNSRVIQGDHWKWVYRECVIASPNWMIRKDELLGTGGFNTLSYPEDYHLVLRWYQAGFEIKGIPEVTLLWREHSDRTSRKSAKYSQESFFRLKLDHFLRFHGNGPEPVIVGAGIKGKLTARHFMERKVRFRWMVHHPERYPGGILGHAVEGFHPSGLRSGSRLLIAVFPESDPMTRIIKCLDDAGLKMGSDYWFL